jgi:hypothetical protein
MNIKKILLIFKVFIIFNFSANAEIYTAICTPTGFRLDYYADQRKSDPYITYDNINAINYIITWDKELNKANIKFSEKITFNKIDLLPSDLKIKNDNNVGVHLCGNINGISTHFNLYNINNTPGFITFSLEKDKIKNHDIPYGAGIYVQCKISKK